MMRCLGQEVILYLIILGPYLNLVYVIDVLPSYTQTTDASQEGDFREIAVQYMRLTAVVQLFDICIAMISKYYIIQRYTKFVYAVSLVMLAVHVLANYVLVSVLGLGVRGLALAALITRIVGLSLSIVICCTMVRRGRFMWSGFSLRILCGWKPMIKFGLSGTVNMFAEIAIYEIATFVSQFDGITALSTIVINFQVLLSVFSVAIGMRIASVTLVGTALGQANTKDVKDYMVLSVLNTLVGVMVLTVAMYCFRRKIVGLFSNDSEVIELFCKTLWIMCIVIPLDHLQHILNRGILSAFGKQRFSAILTTACCYSIGLPIILLTVFYTDMVVSGIYLGFTAFTAAILVGATVRVFKLDIAEEIEKTKERIDESSLIYMDNNDGDLEELHLEESTTNRNTSALHGALNTGALNTGALQGDLNTGALQGDLKEVRNVVVVFILSALVCVVLSGVSLLKSR